MELFEAFHGFLEINLRFTDDLANWTGGSY